FTNALTKDYFKLSRVEYYYSHDKFAVKAREADKGKNVLPDNPAKQKKLKRKNRWRSRLITSYDRLMGALKGGFREQNPKQASRAQTAFDCWLWAVIDKDTRCIPKCRKRFLAAMNAWSPPMAMPMAKPMAKPKPKPAPPPARSYIVFFDWDKSTIRADAQKVIDAAAAYSKRRGFVRVDLSGHADRSGSPRPNIGLSQRRAAAVKAAFVKLGVKAGNITTVGKGESQPLVSTADGVREPRNRRVEIVF
ncbi:MAG: OmpA family protein, partial [Alphaproteobacteria bacterium]|nr:OmpA family protein [Alphaproteobacteria bacterium]